MFKAAARGCLGRQGKPGEVFIDLFITDMFGQAVEMKADRSNALNVVPKRTLALATKDDLLLDQFPSRRKTFNSFCGLLYNCKVETARLKVLIDD